MQTIKAQIEVKVKDKDHTYLCETNCSLPECYEALSMMRFYIYGRMKEEQENAEKASQQSQIPQEQTKEPS